MKKSLIVFLSLLFYTFIFIYGWHLNMRTKTYLPVFFSVVYYAQFFLLMFLLLDRFFIVDKQRKKWAAIFFGAITATIVGGISWIEASYLDTYLRPIMIHSWNREGMTTMTFILRGVVSGMIATLSTVIGICSALTSRWLIHKFEVKNPKID